MLAYYNYSYNVYYMYMSLGLTVPVIQEMHPLITWLLYVRRFIDQLTTQTS